MVENKLMNLEEAISVFRQNNTTKTQRDEAIEWSEETFRHKLKDNLQSLLSIGLAIIDNHQSQSH